VLPKNAPLRSGTIQARGGSGARPLATTLPSGRQAMTLSASVMN
jgi:hypothetical protein